LVQNFFSSLVAVDDSSEEDDGEEVVATKRTRSLRSPPAKKPPRWKEIDKKYITDVTLGVLEYMVSLCPQDHDVSSLLLPYKTSPHNSFVASVLS